MMATITNVDIPTSVQDQDSAAMSALMPVAMIDGMASVRKTVLATYRRCDLGTESARTMSKQAQTTTTVCPMASKSSPALDPANITTEEPNT